MSEQDQSARAHVEHTNITVGDFEVFSQRLPGMKRDELVVTITAPSGSEHDLTFRAAEELANALRFVTRAWYG